MGGRLHGQDDSRVSHYGCCCHGDRVLHQRETAGGGWADAAAPTAPLETAVPVEVGAVGDTIAEYQENAAIVDGTEAESQEERVEGDVLLISVEAAATSTTSEICDV